MINFFSDKKYFTLTNKKDYRNWIRKCIKKFDIIEGEISYNFITDNELLKINKETLNHNYFTDIITFDQKIGELISGDIFISIDRVTENAKKFNVDFETELKRVVIHGFLHIVGFNDHTEQEKSEMRNQENLCIQKFTKVL
jgi:rRNA maturation RNase YbeY